MSVRNRERVTRNCYNDQDCEACGSTQHQKDMSRKLIPPGTFLLCSTCTSALRRDGRVGLKAYLRLRVYHRDSDVNGDLYEKL